MANPNLKLFKSTIPAEEIGTAGNPIDFGTCPAGQDTALSYDILLWNDKGAALGSDDAKAPEIELVRFSTSENWVSDGSASQTFTMSYIPVLDSIDVAVTVDGDAWTEVSSLAGMGPTDEIFTFNYVTGVLTFGDGVNGKIPPNTETIENTYTPDSNIFGKLIYDEQWISIKSSGVIQNEIHIGSGTPEESTKIDDDTIQVIHYPELSDVVGVWDNPGKSGTNYYTGGSYDSNTGRITLGTSLVADDAYTEYKYRIKDDAESAYTALGNGDKADLGNRIPQNNAKQLQLKVAVPATSSTEGGVNIKIQLRVYYES